MQRRSMKRLQRELPGNLTGKRSKTLARRKEEDRLVAGSLLCVFAFVFVVYEK